MEWRWSIRIVFSSAYRIETESPYNIWAELQNCSELEDDHDEQNGIPMYIVHVYGIRYIHTTLDMYWMLLLKNGMRFARVTVCKLCTNFHSSSFDSTSRSAWWMAMAWKETATLMMMMIWWIERRRRNYKCTNTYHVRWWCVQVAHMCTVQMDKRSK